MSARDLYEGVLIETSKESSLNLLLEDFNYFANKAINLWVNKRYNIYDVNQQTTDDLGVLKDNAMLDATRLDNFNDLSLANMATYEVTLPQDYLHLLNCICIYEVLKTYKCYNKNDTWRAAATRLTADAYSQVLDNFWHKPSYKNPYYYLHNTINTGKNNADDSTFEENGEYGDAKIAKDKLGNTTIKLGDNTTDDFSLYQKSAGVRYGNNASVKMLIRYGTDDSIFKLKKVYVDYLKAPKLIRLTQEQLDTTEDTSQMLEFPDYVCQEILNELVHIIMENQGDPRILSHPVVSLSIANPAQALAPEAAGQSAQQ